MRTFLERTVHSLDRPLEPGPRGMLVLASLLLLAAGLTRPASGEPGWTPFAVGALGLLTLRAAVYGKLGSLLDAFVLTMYFGVFSLGYWLSHAGIEAPAAALPGPGSILLAAASLILGVALLWAWRQNQAEIAAFKGVG